MDNILPTLDIMYYHIYTLIHYMEQHVKLLFLKNDLCFEARTRTGSVLHISNLFKSTRDLFIRRLSNNFSMKENLILYEFRRYFELYMLKAFSSFEKLNVMSKDESSVQIQLILKCKNKPMQDMFKNNFLCIHEVFASRKIHIQRPQRSNKERPPVQLV